MVTNNPTKFEWNPLSGLRGVASTKLWRTDGHTDGRTDTGISMSPFRNSFRRGTKITAIILIVLVTYCGYINVRWAFNSVGFVVGPSHEIKCPRIKKNKTFFPSKIQNQRIQMLSKQPFIAKPRNLMPSKFNETSVLPDFINPDLTFMHESIVYSLYR